MLKKPAPHSNDKSPTTSPNTLTTGSTGEQKPVVKTEATSQEYASGGNASSSNAKTPPA
nr:MAG TPA: hypothetical protein [Caudoviricetes sp.]